MDDRAGAGPWQALVTEFLARRIAGVQVGEEARLATIEGDLDAWLRLNGLACHLRRFLVQNLQRYFARLISMMRMFWGCRAVWQGQPNQPAEGLDHRHLVWFPAASALGNT